jgi:hypothetical protein
VPVLAEPPGCTARERRQARTDGLCSLNALARIVRTSTYKEAVVAIAMLLDFGTPPGSQDDWDVYDRANRELCNGEEPRTAAELGDGMLAHFVGTTQDGRHMIVNVFESQEAMERQMARIMPMRDPGVEPRVEILTLHNVLT